MGEGGGNARGRRTREALLVAAREVLERDGFEALTMAAAAERAGVSRRAVYLHFRSRGELVAALSEHVAGSEGLYETLRPVWDAPDGVAALEAFARHLAHYQPRVLAVERAVERVRDADPDAAWHRGFTDVSRRSSAREIVERLRDEGLLAPPWTVETATDMLWALMSVDVAERLTVGRRWPPERYAEHLAAVFRGAFVARG
ncbi:hypothetical protein GCM10027168_22700 [Streptomyces capparidis]